MTINLTLPTNEEQPDFKPKITVIGVGGAGGNAVNNMIHSGLDGVDFLVANSDAQALLNSKADRRIQLGSGTTRGLGAGSNPEIGRSAAEESQQEIFDHLQDCNMVFITAGLGGGTGTGAAPVIARLTRDSGILTVGVVTKPFHFEGAKRMQIAEQGLEELQHYVDTLLIIPNQHLFRVANEKTTFADAFKMADDVLYSGVRGVTDLMVMPGLINLDFSDIRSVMSEMGKAMMGAGEAEGEKRAIEAAEKAINNPLLDDVSMKGARGVLINITAGEDITLFEVDEAANRIRDEVDEDANIIFGSTFDANLDGSIRVSLVATGIDASAVRAEPPKRDLADPQPAPEPVQILALPEEEMPQPEPQPAPMPESWANNEAPDPVAMFPSSRSEDILPEMDSPEEEPEISADEPVLQMDRETPSEEPTEVPKSAVMPRVTLRDVFIPAAPTDEKTGRAERPKADPFAAADMINTGKEKPEAGPRRKSGLSLFERVTGVNLGSSAAKTRNADPQPIPSEKPMVKAVEPVEEPAPTPVAETVAAPMPEPQPEPQPESQPEPVAEMAPEPAAEPAPEAVVTPMPETAPDNLLGPITPAERVSDPHENEDLLDIPAFLRRQAN